SVEVAAMTGILREEGVTMACSLTPPSVDYLLLEGRRSLAARRRPRRQFVWDPWCDLMVAGAVWLVLLGAALIALSAVARPHLAEAPRGYRGAEIVAAAMTEPSPRRAADEMLP